MIKTTTIAIISILAVLLIYLFPKQTISPGDLSGGHQNLEHDCMKCHTMFFGTPGEKCVFCHKPAEVGIVTTAGIKIEKNPGQGKAAFHHLFSKDSCLSCHPDHKGRNMGKADRQFSHDLINAQDIHRCRSCHQEPVDNVHSNSNQECNTCHTMDRWRPATLDHAQYFRFDKDHKSDCATCHQNNNYKEYTCYGCHEHSPEKIRGEHLDEGIHNYKNCAACHRSADEDEAKRIFRSGRYQNPSWKGHEREEYYRHKGNWESGYNDYVDDDDDDSHEDDDSDHDRRSKHDDD